MARKINAKARYTGDLTPVAMVARWFEIENIFKTPIGNDVAVNALVDEQSTIIDLMQKTPSRTAEDFAAKLRFAMWFVEDKDGIWHQLPKLLATFTDDYEQMRDRVDEGEMAIVIKANSFEEYFALIGEPMPEPIAAE